MGISLSKSQLNRIASILDNAGNVILGGISINSLINTHKVDITLLGFALACFLWILSVFIEKT